MLSLLAVKGRACHKVWRAAVSVGCVVAALMLGSAGQADAAPLSEGDAQRYSRIFALQKDGRWKEADRLIATLENDVLIGHVQHQRYMHPTAYRSSFKELQAWLARHADHPDAARVHALAATRGKGTLRRPDGNALNGWGGPIDGASSSALHGSYGGENARTARRVWTAGWRALRRGHTLSAKNIIEGDDAKRVLTRLDHDRLRAGLAYAYFVHGRDEWALTWGTTAIEGSGQKVPLASWAAGLASWRTGNLEAARGHFARLAGAKDASPWLTSAGAYWAGRAALRTRHPEEVSGFLHQAAEHPRTFYGLLARRALGLPIAFDWKRDTLDDDEAAALAALPGGRRALALVQIGDMERAEQELRLAYPRADADARAAIVRLADSSGMSALALYLAAARSTDAEEPGGETGGENFVSAFYPVPLWEPEGGWTLDRALLFAFMRQESGFNPDARSYAGARGLMQVMPATAAYIAGDPALRRAAGRAILHSPEGNLALGQKYLDYLLKLPEVDGNLFFAAVAYNGGPGNLRKWRKAVQHDNDPLLFIESIPSRETRLYVERVIANLWMYRSRMGQTSPSLDMVAAGDWPHYAQQDKLGLEVAAR